MKAKVRKEAKKTRAYEEEEEEKVRVHIITLEQGTRREYCLK